MYYGQLVEDYLCFNFDVSKREYTLEVGYCKLEKCG